MILDSKSMHKNVPRCKTALSLPDSVVAWLASDVARGSGQGPWFS